MRSAFLILVLYTGSVAQTGNTTVNRATHIFSSSVKYFEFSVPGSPDKKVKMCLGQFSDGTKSVGSTTLSAFTPLNSSDCTEIKNYENNNYGTFSSAKLFGHETHDFSKKNLPFQWDGEQYAYHLKPTVLRYDATDSGPIHDICVLTIYPVRKGQQKSISLLCKLAPSSGSIEGEFVCPLPAKCASPEFAIKPVLEMMPGSDDDLTPHALTSRNPTHR